MTGSSTYIIYYCQDGEPKFAYYGRFNSLYEANLAMDQATKIYPDDEYQLFEQTQTRIR